MLSRRRRWLAHVSRIQLCVGVVSAVVAVRRHHPYDVPLFGGRPDRVARDSVLIGTALSAPITMLVTQGVATARQLRHRTDLPDVVLGVLGAAMVAGYLAESLVRRRLRPSGADCLETPLILVGIGLASAMAVLGLSNATPESINY